MMTISSLIVRNNVAIPCLESNQLTPIGKKIALFSASTQKTRMAYQAMASFCAGLPFQKIEPFNYSSEDLTFLELKEGELPDNDLSCFNYAFMKIREKRALDDIVKNRFTSIMDPLVDWGYRPILDPKDGDLVLYFRENEREPRHAGIYRSDRLVESKWGNYNPDVFWHYLFDCLPAYGNKAIFMQRSE